jgi:hypothetical protein
MDDVTWETAYSVDVNVTPAFAWSYLTDVSNWNDPPAKFELYGAFVVGAKGATRIPGEEPLEWRLERVSPMEVYRLEMALDRARILFEWQFDGVDVTRTRLTQHIGLNGENAGAYLEQVKSQFSVNLSAGMSRIASAMERAYASSRA